VPGTPQQLLANRLPAADGWTFGGPEPPQPSYSLSEGSIQPDLILLPTGGSWLQRVITGPAEVTTAWFWPNDPTVSGRFTVDEYNVGGAQSLDYRSPSYDPTISLPPGAHTLRWEHTGDPEDSFPGAILVGRCDITAPVIAAEDVQGLIWINQGSSEYRWRSLPGQVSAGTTALTARDIAQGTCLVTGPGSLHFMLNQDGRSVFTVTDDAYHSYFYSSEADGWHPVTILIGPGQHRLIFRESYCEPTYGNEIAWVDELAFRPSAYVSWLAGYDEDPYLGQGWEQLDSDDDGLLNVLEYAFGTDPLSARGGPIGPACSLVNGQMRLTFPTLPYATTGLNYIVETSPDMSEWTTHTPVPSSAAHQPGPHITVPEGGRQYVRTRVEAK
jgi:hypothetical protein